MLKEKLEDQVSFGANCSSALVAQDVILTVALCFEDISCEEMKVVFDFGGEPSVNNGQGVLELQEANIYNCSEPLYRDEVNDLALIKLDRKVLDRSPLSWRKAGRVEKETPLFVVGSPVGLTTKIARGLLLGIRSDGVLGSDYDSTDGLSGAPVLSGDGILEGIHSASAPAIGDQEGRSCSRWLPLEENEINSLVTPISAILNELEKLSRTTFELGQN